MNAQIAVGCVPLGPRAFWSEVGCGEVDEERFRDVKARDFFLAFDKMDRWMHTEDYILVEVCYGVLAIVRGSAEQPEVYALWKQAKDHGGSVWYRMRQDWVMWHSELDMSALRPAPLKGAVCAEDEVLWDMYEEYPGLRGHALTFGVLVGLMMRRSRYDLLNVLSVRAVGPDAVVLVRGGGCVDAVRDAVRVGLYQDARVMSPTDVLVECPLIVTPLMDKGYCYLDMVRPECRRAAFIEFGAYPSVGRLREHQEWLVDAGMVQLATTSVAGLLHVGATPELALTDTNVSSDAVVGADPLVQPKPVTDWRHALVAETSEITGVLASEIGLSKSECDVAGVLRIREHGGDYEARGGRAVGYVVQGQLRETRVWGVQAGDRLSICGNYLVRGSCQVANWRVAAEDAPVYLSASACLVATSFCVVVRVPDGVVRPDSRSNVSLMAAVYDADVVELFYPMKNHSPPDVDVGWGIEAEDGSTSAHFQLEEGKVVQVRNLAVIGGLLVNAPRNTKMKFGVFRCDRAVRVVFHRGVWNVNELGFVVAAGREVTVDLLYVSDAYAWDCAYDSDCDLPPIDSEDELECDGF